MLGRTPPSAIVTLPSSLFCSSALGMASCRRRGTMHILLSRATLPASSQPSGTPARQPYRQGLQLHPIQHTYILEQPTHVVHGKLQSCLCASRLDLSPLLPCFPQPSLSRAPSTETGDRARWGNDLTCKWQSLHYTGVNVSLQGRPGRVAVLLF